MEELDLLAVCGFAGDFIEGGGGGRDELMVLHFPSCSDGSPDGRFCGRGVGNGCVEAINNELFHGTGQL